MAKNISVAFGLLVALMLGLVACGGDAPEADAEFIAMPQPDAFAMIIAPDAEVAATEAAVIAQCQGRQFCKVMGWTDKANAARSLPMLDREMEAMAFSYFVNRNEGAEEFAWDCARFPQPDPARCLAK